MCGSSGREARTGESGTELKSYRWRSALILGLVVCGAVGLGARAVELQLIDHGFLAKQGDQRSMRVVKIAAHRGAITDRSGEPLAVSTPVDTVWVNPQELNENIDQLPKLAKALKQDQQLLARRITSNLDREFLYLERHMPPDQAERIKALGIPGRLPAAGIPPLLPCGRGGGPRGRVHESWTIRGRKASSSASISC